MFDVMSVGTEVTQKMPTGYFFWRVQDVAGAASSWTSPWEMRIRRQFPGYAPAVSTSAGTFSDYNGDGYPDVAVFGAAPIIYLGGPDGISNNRVWRTQPNAVPYSDLGRLLMEPQVDVNGDGFTDLSSRQAISVAGQDWPTYAAEIQFGASGGLAGTDALVDVVTSYYPLFIDEPLGLGDIDGDGFGDLIMQLRYGAEVIRGCTPAPPNAVWASLVCGNCQLQQVATGDFDGDGRTDVIFADGTGIDLYMGTPTPPTPIGINGMSGLWVIDFNYDGYSDLVIWDQLPTNTLRAYEGGPNGLSPTPSTAAQPAAFVMVGDFDGDGYWDTIGPSCSASGCPTVTSVAYGGPGDWGAPPTRTTPMDRSIADSAAIVVDVNRDGYDDLLVPGTGNTTLSWYAGSPSGLSSVPTVVVTP